MSIDNLRDALALAGTNPLACFAFMIAYCCVMGGAITLGEWISDRRKDKK